MRDGGMISLRLRPAPTEYFYTSLYKKKIAVSAESPESHLFTPAWSPFGYVI